MAGTGILSPRLQDFHQAQDEAQDRRMSIAFLAPPSGPVIDHNVSQSTLSSCSQPLRALKAYSSRSSEQSLITAAVKPHPEFRLAPTKLQTTTTPLHDDRYLYRRDSILDDSSNSDDSEETPASRSARRKPRPPRPSYSEEQRFYIMFSRICKDMTWPNIEDGFCNTFGQRTKGGLTSVYYRIRRSWGMDEVLRGNADSFSKDREIVCERAAHFSDDFLLSINYLNSGPDTGRSRLNK